MISKGATTTPSISTIASYGTPDTGSVVTYNDTSGGVLTTHSRQPNSPKGFHVHHGSSITVSADNSTATSSIQHWQNTMCFSNRSVHVNERVALRVANITTMAEGFGDFGFTSVDPTTLDPASLPQYPNQHLADVRKEEFWLYELLDRSTNVVVGDTVHFYFMANGSVCYGINDYVRISSFSVPTHHPLWVAIDMNGKLIKLQFVNF